MGDQNLTVLSKLSDVMDLDKSDPSNKVVDSPTFGFKESLIELLTNLIWEHHENQSLVGELDGVALAGLFPDGCKESFYNSEGDFGYQGSNTQSYR